MKIAIFGGSFNPVHKGHLALAECVCNTFGYDKLLFVPASEPPHKIVTVSALAEDRLQMLRLACEADSRFEVETCEIERGGISYTWDTVCYIEEKYSAVLEGKPGLVVGQDLSAEFGKWKNAAKLADKTDIILAHRPRDEQSGENCISGKKASNKNRGQFAGVFATEEMLNAFPYPHKIIYNPLIDISSTGIREKIENKEDLSGLVPEKVYCYIKQRKLYGYKI